MGWPAEGDPHELFAHYYNTVADGLVNDRWVQTTLPPGRPARALYLRFVAVLLRSLARAGRGLPGPKPAFHFDFETHEYASPAEAPPSAWELTRGLGTAFGNNAQETAANLLSGASLVHLLADVVSKGGNLLINVGPDGAGRIPEVQQRPLRELGSWLRTNGEAIFGTRSWTPSATTTADGEPVRLTRKGGDVYIVVLAAGGGERVIICDTAPPAGARIGLLGAETALEWRQSGRDLEVRLPPHRPPTPAPVLRVCGAAGRPSTQEASPRGET
jgi:alpha-L-fucosidase